MSSTFGGLNIATSGLQAQQAAMNVVGHNIANANNAAYKRQQAVMGARTVSAYGSTGVTPLGQGTDVTTIRRMQDNFVDTQMLGSTQNMGRFQAGKDTLDQIVGIVGEPSDTALGGTLDKFWNAWQNLSNNPSDATARATVVQAGSNAAADISRLYTQIKGVQAAQGDAIKGGVQDVNRLATQLASLNDQIQQAKGSGSAPNDLLDQRDAVLGQLSGLADIQVHGDGGAGDVITLGGHALVQGSQAIALSTGADAAGNVTVTWAEEGTAARISGGDLGGRMELQSQVIPKYLSSLDSIAKGLMSGVNTLHAAGKGLDGTTGVAFFTGTGAADIGVNAAIVQDPRKVAASTGGAAGDGSVALAIAKVKDQAVVGASTIGAAYRGFVAQNAGDADGFSRQLSAQTQIHQQITNQQQSISGVSVDEELSNMVQFQQAYNASARVFSTMNDMIGVVINQMGAG